jgi:hypothetical protein
LEHNLKKPGLIDKPGFFGSLTVGALTGALRKNEYAKVMEQQPDRPRRG